MQLGLLRVFLNNPDLALAATAGARDPDKTL